MAHAKHMPTVLDIEERKTGLVQTSNYKQTKVLLKSQTTRLHQRN